MVKLKTLVNEILTEGRGGNQWIEPNGTIHSVADSPTHWHWADDYVRKMNWSVTKDPYQQLIDRGWIRVIYSYTESLIMVYHKGQLTRQQKEYLEDQAEKTEWLVMDDDGRVIYRPIDCITPDNDRENQLQEASLGYNFREFKWLARSDGFDYPIDVSYGTVYLGTLEVKADGYHIKLIDTPQGRITIHSGIYKNRDIAVHNLHRFWKQLRGARI